jgi:protein-tyrosine phosphatase
MFRRPPDAARVISGLWIGSAAAARHAARLARDGIDRVVDLREQGPEVSEWPPQILISHIPLADHGTPTTLALEAAATAVTHLVKQGHEVLVHCQAGIERAPMVVCAALVIMGWSLTDAYQRVLEVRPEAAPTDAQLAVLRALAAERSARGDSASTPR